jgi:hypothetical protein
VTSDTETRPQMGWVDWDVIRHCNKSEDGLHGINCHSSLNTDEYVHRCPVCGMVTLRRGTTFHNTRYLVFSSLSELYDYQRVEAVMEA